MVIGSRAIIVKTHKIPSRSACRGINALIFLNSFILDIYRSILKRA